MFYQPSIVMISIFWSLKIKLLKKRIIRTLCYHHVAMKRQPRPKLTKESLFHKINGYKECTKVWKSLKSIQGTLL